MSQARSHNPFDDMPNTNPFDDADFLRQRQVAAVTPSNAQKVLQTAFRYTNGMATSLFFGAEVFPPVPMPFGEMMGFAAVNVNILTGDVLHAVLSKEHPMTYLTKAGRGNAGLGFAKEAGKFVAALVPPMAAGLGIGYAIVLYGDDLAHATHPALQALNFVVQRPMVREPILGLISFGMHSGTKALIECCLVPPKVDPEVNPQLRGIQSVLRFVLRPMGAVSLYEVLRLALITSGAESPLHNPNFPALVVACDQLLQAWGYMAFVPRPLRNLVPTLAAGMVPEDIETGVLSEHSDAAIAQSKAHALSWYFLRTGFVLSAGAMMLNWGLSQIHKDGERIEDKEKLETGYRLAYEAALVLGSAMTEKLIEHTPRFFAWSGNVLSRCTAGLFSSRTPVPVRQSEEDLLLPDNSI